MAKNGKAWQEMASDNLTGIEWEKVGNGRMWEWEKVEN